MCVSYGSLQWANPFRAHTLPVVNLLTGGEGVSYGSLQWANPFRAHNPPVVNLTVNLAQRVKEFHMEVSSGLTKLEHTLPP